ncbi:glycosyltransferase [Candidatus Uhrbacteria bacterium]|nr:glycosyltransferase [Candidatus Uhrbacteria bacterium]
MKIALVHDHLVAQLGGAERVLKIFHEIFPEAPIFTLLYDRKRFDSFFGDAEIHTSFLQKFPFTLLKYQWLLPFMPTATEQYDLSNFDVVLSSSSAFSKGIITKSTTLHVSYCHTPTRYLWTDTQSYVRELKIPSLIKRGLPFLLSRLRVWDRVAADRVDRFIANSKTVQERIKKYYRRKSDIIYPPVETEKLFISHTVGDYFLAGGRLVSYKRFDIIVEAFNNLGRKVKIFGTGPEYHTLRKLAKKPNIEFIGQVSDEERARLYSACIAFINPQEEDFGITTIEAMASGRPVIALAAGGALETISDGITGTFFYDQDWPALADAIIRFRPEDFSPERIREYSMQFNVDRFKNQIVEYIERSRIEWQERQHMKRLRETKKLF